MRRVKLVPGRHYLLPSDSLVKILSTNTYLDTIIVHNFSNNQNEVMEVSLAERILTPVFKLNEVALALGKKSETIRRYEREGILSRARQVRVGQRGSMRVYTREEVETLADFFDERVVGRPSGRGTMNRPVNRDKIEEMYNKLSKEK